ncbi:MAG: ATP-dependent zinc metalloprotease FtsH [Deltaproteobacteria bacterium]|nr:ATP-dependent zinc metalloprotease FtsH [Deltaproteobacteria bacterium]
MPDGDSTRRKLVFAVVYALTALLLLWGLQATVTSARERPMTYSELLVAVSDGRVESVHLDEDRIHATLRTPDAKPDANRDARPDPKPDPKPEAPKDRVIVSRLPGIDETALVAELRSKGVAISGSTTHLPWWKAILASWLLPLLLFGGALFVISRRVARGAGGPLSVGKSRAKVYDLNQNERVTFADVAGVDEAKGELVEIVSFLRDPSPYRALGARPPRGVLLVGPPGTGKTLLARAVAGEAGVPFFSLSGSEFVEMFVGVGAARVRDLFQQAKERAPCIVFIDELDAVGKTRALVTGGVGGHEEREQTLNQLLSEMDGFDAGSGVVILAATNRPEVLDRALLRAGRFDRQILVDRPDVRGREAILRVHVRKLVLAPSVDLELVARRTPGMSGAELANVVNEAALAAARRKGQSVEQPDFEIAIDRIQLGLEKQGRVLGTKERVRVAYHEAGHALVALSVEGADPVHRVTIIPRSIGALGATLQLPVEERHLLTKTELLDRICVAMGGRCAEELACAEPSTGAENDLEHASELARQMVRRFGMSERVGPVTYGSGIAAPLLDPRWSLGEPRTWSERTAVQIDAEERAIVDAAKARARRILEERRDVLEAIAARLQQDETLDRAALEEIVKTTRPLPAAAE